MKVKDIMTKQVANLNPGDTVERAADLMRQYNVGSIPICNEEKVVGIITDRDIAIRSVADGENSKIQKVRDVMTSNPICGTSEMDIDDASRVMSENQIRRLPIVENRNLVGIVSLGDFAVEPKAMDEAADALTEISVPSVPTF